MQPLYAVYSILKVASVFEGKSADVSTPHALILAPDPTPKMREQNRFVLLSPQTQTAVVIAMKGEGEREADGI